MAKVSLKGPIGGFFFKYFFNFEFSYSSSSFLKLLFRFSLSLRGAHIFQHVFLSSFTTRLLRSLLFPCQHLYLLFIKKTAGWIIPLHPASPYSFGKFLCDKTSSVICTILFMVLQRGPFQFSCVVLMGTQPETLIVYDTPVWLQDRSIRLGEKIDSHMNCDLILN